MKTIKNKAVTLCVDIYPDAVELFPSIQSGGCMSIIERNPDNSDVIGGIRNATAYGTRKQLPYYRYGSFLHGYAALILFPSSALFIRQNGEELEYLFASINLSTDQIEDAFKKALASKRWRIADTMRG